MSEQLYEPDKIAKFLFDFTSCLISGSVSRDEVLTALAKMAESKPKDFISAVDLIVEKYPVSLEMKKGINKMLNVFYTHLSNLPKPKLRKDSFLQILVDDNRLILEKTKLLKPLIKELQIPEEQTAVLWESLDTGLKELIKIEQHFQVTENILFSFLEKQWPDHKCFQVLWSVHDDVREELRSLQKISKLKNLDLKHFNRLVGDLFFNINTIIFREEKILIPAIVEAGFEKALDEHLTEASEIGWSFVKLPKKSKTLTRKSIGNISSLIQFDTGSLSPAQIEMIFNHLPVDITFVDENDTVQYFSIPKKRTFTRTNAVISRKVQNCHPPESVWMVEEILDAFRKGEQDDASFWIPFGEQFVYIQYFALRDASGKYCGTIEVTQDVKNIRELEGERRLLNWKKN